MPKVKTNNDFEANLAHTSLPQLTFADHLRVLNREPRRDTPNFHIDTGGMLCMTLGNPIHFRFNIEGNEQDIAFSIGQKDAPVAACRLYRDPNRGGGYFRPDVEPRFRNLGLGVVSYLTAGRLTRLLWQEDLHSNAQQLSPSAHGVWQALCKHDLAITRGHKDFTLKQSIAESASVAALLDTVLDMRRGVSWHEQTSLYEMPAVNPEVERRNLAAIGKRKPYEYWLHTF